MVKHARKTGKRALAICMSILMLMTSWVFVAPTASAITSQTAGTYDFKFVMFDRDNGCNGEKGIKIKYKYKANNGRGDESNEITVVDQSDQNFSGSGGESNGRTEYARGVNGFISYMYGYVYQENLFSNGDWSLKVYVSKAGADSWTECQNLNVGSTTSRGSVSSSTTTFNNVPTPTCTYSGSTSLSTDGSRTETYTVLTAKDQFNVDWGFTSVTWASSNSAASITNGGVATFGYNNGVDYDVTLTPTLVHTKGNRTPTGITVHVEPYKNLQLNTEMTVNHTTSQDLYYRFTPSTSGDYVFFTYDSDNTPDPYLYIYTLNSSNAHGLGSSVTSADDGNSAIIRKLIGGSDSSIGTYQTWTGKVSLTGGTTYVVRAYDRGNVGSYPMKVCKAVDITFNATGGSSTFTQTLPAGHTLYMDMTGITRSGHDLFAWSTTGDNAQPKSFMTNHTARTVPNTDTTYYALWFANDPTTMVLGTDYTVTIGSNYQVVYFQFTPTETRNYVIYSHDGSGNPYGILLKRGDWADSATVWKTDDNSGSGNHFQITQELEAAHTYMIGAKYQSSGTGSFPIRIATAYTLHYNANGGSGAPADQTKIQGIDLTLSSTVPTRTGYTFLGWATHPSSTTADYQPGGTFTEDRDETLYAVWQINQSTLTVNPNGGVWDYYAPNGSPFTRSYQDTLSIPDPTRVGYNFTGWTLNSSSNGSFNSGSKIYTFGSTAGAADTLTAGWSQNGYSVTYPGAHTSGTPTSAQGAASLNATVTAAANYHLTDNVTVKVGNKTLTRDTDYTYTLSSNKRSATVAINAGLIGDSVTINAVAEACSGGTATCTTAATCSTCNTTYGSEDANNHDWDYAHATFNWSGYSCPNATVKCTRNASHTTTVNTTVTSEVTAAAVCNANGTKVYTAKFIANNTEYTSTKTETLTDTANHDYITVASASHLKTAATCTTAAVYYKYCSRCGANHPTETFTSGNPDTSAHSWGAWTKVDDNTHKRVCANSADHVQIESHTWTAGTETPATCTADGSQPYSCATCGGTKTETIPALGHSFSGDWTVRTPATCTTAGEEYRVCGRTGCNAEETRAIPATGHTIMAVAAVEPTCTTPGTYGYTYCNVCKQILTINYEDVTANNWTTTANASELVWTDADAHNWGDWTVKTAATCIADGVEERVCSYNSSHKETRPIAALGHDIRMIAPVSPTCITSGNYCYTYCNRCNKILTINFADVSSQNITYENATPSQAVWTDANAHNYGEWVITSPANCTTDGVMTCTCSYDSSHTDTKVIPKTGHNWGDWTVRTAATCTTDGVEERVCANDTNLNHVETRLIPKLGHDWSAWTVQTAATCTANGVEERHCQRTGCNESETRTIPKLDHNWSAWDKTNEDAHSRTCSVGGETDTGAHDWIDIVDPDALVSASSNPCASGVSYYKTCSVCGRISNTQTFTTQTAGHKLVAVPAQAPTCTEAGHDAYWQCAVCSKYFSDANAATAINAPVVIAARGHDFDLTATPVETTGGHMYPCTRCNGYGFGNALGAVEAHTYDQQNRGNRYIAGTASDCGQTASYYYSCKCGAVGTTTFSEPGGTLNHNLTAHAAVAATCANEGRIAYWECSRCHRLFSDANGTTEVHADQLSIPKTTNHTWGDWEVKTAATCTADGLRQRECSVCHIVESETITATGHHFTSSTYMPSNNGKHRVKCQDCDVYGPEVACTNTTSTSTAADCTHKGTTTYTCTDCGGSWTVEGALGTHQTTLVAGTAADCTTAGTRDYYQCSVCGKMFADAAGAGTEYTVADLVVQPLGHALTQVAAVAATCTTGGNDAYYTCSRCGGFFRDALGRYEMESADEANTDALGHDWGAWDVTPATCEQAGQKIRECNRCHITEPETIPATGHDYGAWQADGETGHKRICANDNNHIDAAAHTWTNIVDPTKKVPGSECTTGIQYYCTCSVCGYTSTTVTFEVAASGHKTVKHEAVTPTCTTAGNAEYYECSVCGGFFSDENGTTPIDADSWVRAATGHDWDTDHPTWYWVKTDGGYAATVVFTCNNDSTHKQNVEATVTLDASSTTATCTTAGTAKWNAVAAFDGTNYTSSKTETTDQLGHLWGEWTVVNAATCEAAGSEQRTCQRDGCTESETRPIAQLEHKTVYVPAVAPTCTADGSIAHYECALCGNYFSDSQGETPLASIVDAALGHDFDETGTPVEHGDGHYYKCTRCDAYGFDGVVDATTAHVYDQQNNGAIYAKPGSVADCTNEGEFYYSCLCGKSEADDSHTFTAGGSLGHVLSAFPAVTATCKEDGHNAYWYCSRCGNYYKDANANQATTLAAETISHTTITHTMPDTWTETVPATCTADGLESRVCTVCEVYTETQAIPALNHSFTSTTYQSYHNGTHSVKCIRCDVYGDPVDCALSKEIVTTTAADCTHLGTTTYRCTCCGYEWTEENTGVGPHSSTPTHHAAVAATCTTAGSIEYWTCEICGKKFSDAACTTEVTDVTVAALAHEGIAYVAADPADCTHDGVKAHYACPICNKMFSEVTAEHEVNAADLNIPQLGHNFYGAIKDNEDGTHSFKCTRCNAYGNETAHTFDRPIVNDGAHVSDADCLNPAKYHYSCVCGAIDTTGTQGTFDSGVPTGHAYNTVDHWNWDETTTPFTATATLKCDHDNSHTIDRVATVTFTTDAPDCESAGTRHYTAIVTLDNGTTAKDDTKTETVPVVGHSLVKTEAKAATCTTAGNIEYYTCSVCGKFFSDAAGANEITGTTTIPASGHDWSTPTYTWSDDGKTCTAERACERTGCGFTENEVATVSNGKIESAVKTPATCTEMGVTTYTATFENVAFTQQAKDVTDIAKVQHTLTKTDAVEATCQVEGYDAYWTCSVCHKIFSDANGDHEIDAVGSALDPDNHKTLVHYAKVDATCLANGNIEYWHCNDCGLNLVYNDEGKLVATTNTVITAGADYHRFTTHVSAKAPTCTQQGNVEYWTCSVCGKHFDGNTASANEIADVSIAANGHTFEHTAAVPATCTGNGNKEYWYCSVCHQYFLGETPYAAEGVPFSQTVDTAPGHQPVSVDAITVDCETNGRKAYTYCSVCDAILTLDGVDVSLNGWTKSDNANVYTIEALGHAYGEPTWVWAGNPTDGYTSATATFVCANSAEHDVVLTDDTLDINTIEPVHPDNGKTIYTATVTFNGTDYTDTKEVAIVEGHHPERVPAKEATCDAAGNLEYWICNDTDCGKLFLDANALVETTLADVTISALGHNWVNPTWTWTKNGDYYTGATLTFTCANGCNNTQTPEVTFSQVRTEPDCTTAGKIVYTATATFDGETYTDTKEVALAKSGHTLTKTAANPANCLEAGNIDYWTCTNDGCGKIFSDEDARYEITAADTVIPALGHTYNYAGTAYAWAADHSSCTATATCIRCTATDTETKASTNEVKIAATCEAQGIRIYTVDFTNVNFATQTFDEFIPAKGHGTAVAHEGKAATCEEAGFEAYWTCSDCGKMFSDEELTTVIPNPIVVEVLNHRWDYEHVVYSWNDSHEPYTCEATVTCLNDSHHTKKETASITAVMVDATCTANGQTTYTATFLGDTSIPTTSTVAVIPMLYHDFSESIDRAHVVDDTHHNYKCVRCDAYGIGSGETAEAGGSVACTFHGDWFVSENETCTEAGSEWRQCEFCSNRQTQEREASGHKVFEVAAQEATCVAIGNKAYSYCERCGLLLTVDGVSVESQNIKFNSAAAIDLYKTEAPLAHNLTATEAVSATCEEDGNIAYWTCSRCGKIFNVANPTADTAAITLADTVIPATKHDFSGAARHNDGEETHSFKCTKCEAYGIMVNGTPVKNGKEACYGGAADCENAATCARCGTAYGTKLGHNYILQSWTWTGYTSAVAHYVCSNNTTHTKDVTATVVKTDATVTCTEAGQNTYVATATFEDDGRTYTDTDTKTEVVNASGHNWDIENASYSWDANLNCTVTLHCLNNDAHVYTEIGKNTTTTTPAKCEETGNVHYVASFTIDNTLTSEHDETLAALGHKWGNPNWTWTGDDENGYTAAAVSFVCERDSDHTAAPEVTFDKTVVAPTCEKEGRTVYTTTATLDGRTYKDTKLTIQPALGHDWAEPVFSWTGNSTDGYTAATALFACGNDEEHNQTLNCALTFVTDGATCTTPGTVTYTATVRFNGHTYTDTKTADVTQLGHDYRFVDFTWTGNDEDGYTAAVANFKCANDPLHTTTAEATVTTETVDAICEADGKIAYTATVTFEGQEYTDAKIVVIPMLHHNWGDITYTWVKDGDQYKVTALRKCANNPNEHQQTETVTTTSETIESSGCESEGTLRYTATFHDPFTTQYKEEAVAVTGHTLVHTAYQDSTCTEPGNIEYWRCSVCNKIFDNEIASATAFLGTDLAVTVIPAKGHDFVMEGDAMVVIDNEDGTHSFKCSRCDAYGAVIDDVQTLKADGGKIAHAYGAWTVVSEPTCMDVGEKEHVCEVCGNVETAPVGYADHVLYGISAKSPTCTTAGNEAYYFCQVCGKLFTDNTGATETTLEEVTLGATGHDFSGAIRNNGNGTHSYLCVNGCHTYGNPTSHVFDQQVESREYLRNYANCTEPNTYFKSCKCGEKGSDTFTKGEPAGHLMIDFPAQAATCLQAGHTPYSECSRCNYRVGYEVIGATGHGAYYYDEAKSGALSNGTMRWEAYSCENGCGDYYLKATVVSLDAQGNRVPNVNVRITSSNGTNISGKTDNNGELKVGTDYKTGLHPGTYTISLEYVRDGGNYNTHGTVTISADGKVTGSFGTLTPYGGNASSSTGGQPSGEFRCSMCDLNDSMKNKPIIGWFISIIHMYVHAISRIGK